jgi:hypothetical protein
MRQILTSSEAIKRREYYQKYMSIPGNREKIKQQQKERYWKNVEYNRGYRRNYRKNNHVLMEESKNKWRGDNLQKFRAQHIASRRVPLASNCTDCRSVENLERHHTDYSKPLEVVTLCKVCHEKRHSNGEDGLNGKNPDAPEIRYLDGLHRVVVLVKGNAEGSLDIRYWRVKDSFGHIFDCYPSRLYVVKGRSKVRMLLTK